MEKFHQVTARSEIGRAETRIKDLMILRLEEGDDDEGHRTSSTPPNCMTDSRLSTRNTMDGGLSSAMWKASVYKGSHPDAGHLYGTSRRSTIQGETDHTRRIRKKSGTDQLAAAAIQAYWVEAAGGDLSSVVWSKKSYPTRSHGMCMEKAHEHEFLCSCYPDPSLDIMLNIYGLST
eukprot:CAMPEP_0114260418 /NCGR_PEP_ID=MMETSP0058-20121206/20480_1 /TAXON_ID=36894 /ORGANISM="Pyramimonas parkeae, CCMP726" /LENGTH=175 /DNA_ID=CAMNT_0001375659 /DNA_START=185 /DNA_END=712 /DNA_ORIENTATION=-